MLVRSPTASSSLFVRLRKALTVPLQGTASTGRGPCFSTVTSVVFGPPRIVRSPPVATAGS
ncbi:hypothetical protein DK427_19645 [Methylobacterium radiodurans]|uniref:Uncharacterized protein n=1 Tax=Methylobacterium radiodurans TaxID=2202828 RepID=A0A2U8VX08_9HYPH|nr:hypothetical protein DK427_19645 [Methylobacterium radiodurans]